MTETGINNLRNDYTSKDYASLRAEMLELAKERLPEWTDHSPNDLGVLLLELVAYMADNLFYYQDRIADENYLDTATERQNIIKLLRLIGYELRAPTPASADLTLLFKLKKTPEDPHRIITINTGQEFETTAELTDQPVKFRYVGDNIEIHIDKIDNITKHNDQDYLGSPKLRVLQVDEYIENEIVGSSDGSAGQRFPLRRAPLIEDSLMVTVNQGGDQNLIWKRQTSLLDSLATDTFYIVRRDENNVAYIEFGDGRNGAIPVRGINNITATYMAGGGIKGNVPPFSIVKAIGKIDDLEVVYNENQASGGSDAERSEDAVKAGSQVFRSMERAVTARDYEAFARRFGVAKARARADAWNTVNLYIAPQGGGLPTDTLKEDLRNYLEDKRMMTTIVHIHGPRYVNVCLAGTGVIDPYHYTEQVKQQVAEAISRITDFEGVDFEDRIYLSKFYEAIEHVPGVSSIHIKRLATADSTDDLPRDGFIQFGWDEIPYADKISWNQLDAQGRWHWSTPC